MKLFPDTSKKQRIHSQSVKDFCNFALWQSSAIQLYFSRSGSCRILFADAVKDTINVFLSAVPPNVVGTNPENLTVVVNNFISLTCEVTGFPPPDLSWLKNGKPINLNANTFIVPGEESQLFLQPLYWTSVCFVLIRVTASYGASVFLVLLQ